MKYKLKDFVTDEMLVECGFSCNEHPYYFRGMVGFTVLIDVETKEIDISNNVDDIQDLIEKGYVEVIK